MPDNNPILKLIQGSTAVAAGEPGEMEQWAAGQGEMERWAAVGAHGEMERWAAGVN